MNMLLIKSHFLLRFSIYSVGPLLYIVALNGYFDISIGVVNSKSINISLVLFLKTSSFFFFVTILSVFVFIFP